MKTMQKTNFFKKTKNLSLFWLLLQYNAVQYLKLMKIVDSGKKN